MPKQVKTVSLMDLRANIGALISEVIYGDQKIVIERYGSPVCELVKHKKDLKEEDQEARNAKIDQLYGSWKMTREEIKAWEQQKEQENKDYDERMNKLWKGEKI